MKFLSSKNVQQRRRVSVRIRTERINVNLYDCLSVLVVDDPNCIDNV